MQLLFLPLQEPMIISTHDIKAMRPIPLVRLAIFEDSESNDETVVRFDEDAKSDLDNDFDALKMFLSDCKNINLYFNGRCRLCNQRTTFSGNSSLKFPWLLMWFQAARIRSQQHNYKALIIIIFTL